MKPMPEDFPTVCRQMSVRAMIPHYRTSQRTLSLWFKEIGVNPRELGLPRSGDYVKRERPSDYEANAAVMTRHELEKHYHAGYTTVSRWIEESGVRPMAYCRPKKEPVPKPPKEPRVKAQEIARQPAPRRPKRSKYKPAPISPRDDSRRALAAEHLRKERWQVMRCNDAGRFDLKGEFYRVGSKESLMTTDEMIAFAIKKGFQPFIMGGAA